MKPVDARHARAAAARKGFADIGGDHYYFHYHHDGKRTMWRIKMSRGADEYKASHIRSDAKTCGMMDPNDLRKVVTCDLDGNWVRTQYEAWLARQQQR